MELHSLDDVKTIWSSSTYPDACIRRVDPVQRSRHRQLVTSPLACHRNSAREILVTRCWPSPDPLPCHLQPGDSCPATFDNFIEHRPRARQSPELSRGLAFWVSARRIKSSLPDRSAEAQRTSRTSSSNPRPPPRHFHRDRRAISNRIFQRDCSPTPQPRLATLATSIAQAELRYLLSPPDGG